ncbi:hypothetical protein ACFQ4Q_25300, partial [Lysobacter gummosus]
MEILAHGPISRLMLSFFRRKKNETAAEKSSERGFTTEELAAAFPDAQADTHTDAQQAQEPSPDLPPRADAPAPAAPNPAPVGLDRLTEKIAPHAVAPRRVSVGQRR